ncbi:DUF885 domain-containing protein [Microbulbifer rhizosphaerae]|uniref:Uncharacterized protein (DUF885 family) n=1 Tax=Microbulbifer rhizosphaerae TaxID=1562603 RepID=A0A7W4Z9Q6_9GAMM|nr:DUF885 domain-containing protein [Microbulbifer rhizosphaerae]MBB3060460.1 uncharacterized protein (DUF885 family) [Microbulbifer rhizosphaerae]
MRITQTSPLIPTLLALAILGGCQREESTQADISAQSAQDAATETTAAIDPAAETARLTEWLDERYEEQLQFSPTQLSYLGRKELYDQIDDMSEAAEARKLAWQAKSVKELKKNFDYGKLSPEGKTSYDIWVYQYEQAKAAEPFKRHGYIFEQMGGAQSQLPNFLLNFHKVDNASDMEAYIARIGGISRAVGQLLERAKLSAKEGIRPPRFAYEGAIDQSTKLIAGAPFNDGEDAPLWAGAKEQIAALLEAGEIDQKQADALTAEARKALETQFLPAYQELIGWLEADMQKASEEPQGASSLPDGEAYYNQMLAKTTTTELTADEIHQIGLEEVARIRGEMETIKKQVEFEGSLQDFFAFIREDDQFYYPNTEEGRQGYLKDSEAFLNNIGKKLPDYFGLLPKADLIVKRVEAFREQPGGAQHYYPGTPDGSRPGIYYAHLADMSAYSTTDMETVAYHEGNPGHHMQISIAQELEGIPQFRTQAHFTVYVEGWALYAEKLSKEMGAFENPYNLFGHLTAEMWRAIRLVVDTGLHAKGWTEEQAVQYFLENSAIPETAVRSEVRRYLVWPSQATAYKIGMLKIMELRKQAEEQLGDKFDIRGFHDTVLGGGALPVPVLESRVARWVDEVKQA